MTPLGYPKTIGEELGEIAKMTAKMTAKMNSCPLCGFEVGHSLSCPRYEHKTFEEYDQENTDETADNIGCNVMCPAKERYDESTTEEYEEEIRETKD